MTDINFPIIETEGPRFLVTVDLRLYSKEAIIASIYKLSASFYIHQQMKEGSDQLVEVIFESKDESNVVVSNDIPKKFCNILIDEQIRYNTNQQFGSIRDMIVEEAFKPVTK